MINTESEQTTHLTEYYDILLKRKWLILLTVILGVTSAWLYNSWMKPVYRATATLVMGKDQIRSPLTGETLVHESFISQSLAFNTHFRLIKSEPVMEAIIREMDPDQISLLKGMESSPWIRFFNQIKANFRLLTGYRTETKPLVEDQGVLTGCLRARIDANQVPDTLLMQISAEDHDPGMAQDIANAVAKAYIQFDIANRMKSSQNTISWMSEQLYEMKKKLEDAERDFLAYKQEEKLFSMEGRQGQISQKIDDFNSAYIQTRNQRLELDVKLDELTKLSTSAGGVRHIRSLLDNDLINTLHSKLLELEVEQSQIAKVYKSKHPKMVQLRTQIEKTQKKLGDELNKELANLQAQRKVLLVREKALQKSVADFESDALQTNRKELKYAILQRNVDTYSKLYDTLLSKLKQSDIAGESEGSNLHIAEPAGKPGQPVRPRKTRNLTLGFILGLMAGVGLTFLWEYLDRTIRTEEGVQRYLALPVLSVIPKAEIGKHRIAYDDISEPLERFKP